MKQIYGIFDLIAQELVGNIMMQAADASAIRTFTDIAENDKQFARHLHDFNLVCLGSLDLRTCEIVAEYRTILAGSVLAATRAAQEVSTNANA